MPRELEKQHLKAFFCDGTPPRFHSDLPNLLIVGGESIIWPSDVLRGFRVLKRDAFVFHCFCRFFMCIFSALSSCQNMMVGRMHGDPSADVVKKRESDSDILWRLRAYKRRTSVRLRTETDRVA
jgi:hypothetical protein